MAARKRGLGRGLDALLSSAASNNAADKSPSGEGASSQDDGLLKDLPLEFLQPGKYQPRRDMDQEALEELAASIKTQGLMQPVVVRPVGEQQYEIIAGERRWRASQLAGLAQIPVLVREVADDAAIAMALIENIQREDLNPIEEAVAFKRLQDEFQLTQQEVAQAVGKSRSTVANLLRLMSLKEDVRRMLEHGDIEMGHGKALLGLPEGEQSGAAAQVVSKGLSVRQTESLVRRILQDLESAEKEVEESAGAADIRHLQDKLAEVLGADVAISHTAKGKGKLVIKYNNLDELDGILAHIK